MCLTVTIEEAVRGFAAWHYPWKFYDSVRDTLDQLEQEQFESIWQTANDQEHWLSGKTLEEGAANAVKALSTKFPNLAADVVRLVVNGAAYQWK